jgi:hypothetical protein
MAVLVFSEQADDMLDELEATPTRVNLLGRINSALDLLESDPTDIRCRRRRFQNIGCWAISVEADTNEWLILWEEGDAGSSDTVIVRAINPAP